MTAAQLRFLFVFALELVADAVEQLDVALVWILTERGNEGPRHGACGFAANGCIGPDLESTFCSSAGADGNEENSRRLCVLASTPHDYICGTSLGLQILLVDAVALDSLFEQRCRVADHAANITTRIT